MCYQARRTAWAQIQIVHVQLWWADLNLENRAWEEVNNRTWKLKGSSPERPRAMFWAWSFGSWSVQTWGEAGWHPIPNKMVWVLQRHYWGFVEYKPGRDFRGHLLPSPHFTDEFRALLRAELAWSVNRNRPSSTPGPPDKQVFDSLAHAVPLPPRVTFRRPFGQCVMILWVRLMLLGPVLGN